LEIRKQEEYIREWNRLKGLYDNGHLTFDLVKQEIIRYLQTEGLDKINKALMQKAELIILDGTRTIPGLFLNYYYTNDSEYIKIHDSLDKFMNPQSNDYTNVLFVSTCYDVKFRISSLVFRVPVGNDLQVNEAELDNISCIN
jgi:hypothetical protein